MGALHEGHLDLVQASLQRTDVTVVSIFVNPTQFNNPEDYTTYPHRPAEDLAMLEAAGVDFVFLPSVDTMYPNSPRLTLDFGLLDQVLEGAFRPGHFTGVGIIVSKLFHMIQPDLAFFGQKDLQQVAIIRRLVADLSFPVQLHLVPTKRDGDGLALSSRNRRLLPEERPKACLLYQSLSKAKKELNAGKNWLSIRQEILREFENVEELRVEYLELVDSCTFECLESLTPDRQLSLCTAAFVGKTRLIDNLPVNFSPENLKN